MKHTIEQVIEIIRGLGYELISNEYKKTIQKIILKDIEGYYYLTTLMFLKASGIPRKFDKSNPYTIQNIKLWCKINNKPFELVSNKYINAKIKLKWKCLKIDCEEIFDANWSDIFSGNGCGYCRGLQVGLSNCLATKRHDLAIEWHPTKNGDLTPFDFTCGSYKDIWWQCKDNPKHEWMAKISTRDKHNCPYCTGQLPSEDYNLLIDNPRLCEEWNYEKNGDIPLNYTPHSGKSVWWKCNECKHEWEALISNRNKIKGNGCPECNKSHGERECNRVFTSKKFIEINQDDYNNLSNINRIKNTYFIPQKTYKGLIGLGGRLLSYDFYLPKYNLLIEYQGEFHDGNVGEKAQSKKQLKKQIEHDKRKREYTLKNKYNFLEIWYWDFNNIEIILDEYFKQLEVS